MPSRRRFLAATGATVTTLAGCLGSDDLPDYTMPDRHGPPPDPGKHVFGSDGRWSSRGFDAANTRWDYAGTGPVDDAAVRWRHPIAQVGRRAPTVSDDRLFLPDGDRLVALDAGDADELWTASGTAPPLGKPLVREGVVYAALGDDLRALDAGTGEVRWSRSFDGPLTAPATVAGRDLVVGDGERVRVLDAETGEERWSRRLFGAVNYPALAVADYPVVSTEAGEVCALGHDGRGGWRRSLRTTTTAPVTMGRDHVYVAGDDGTVRALSFGGKTEWVARGVEAGRFGVAYTDSYVYAIDGDTLHALGSESGDRHWTFDLGATTGAPTVVGHSVYAGGDRLYGHHPEGDGPRFSLDLGGTVGPDVTFGDGIVYAPVSTGDGAELVAVEPR
ncbi:outer membrane protein assembly factor BamB family protein [Halomarina litorea]|uniref:outer membrane protein assembly factor BamB family protein n=1 Tax=Halomarina litorea TaxID=2961595 RepID=UPI0020C34785|nr:PQQ-binding-like beta-propeller repeat protein [Halomarina sp. BCD28]